MRTTFISEKTLTYLRTTRFPVLVWEGFYRIVTFFPKFIWHTIAICALLTIGSFVTYYFTFSGEIDQNKSLQDQNAALIKLISSYEDLSSLYHSQGLNVGVILDPSLYYSNPSEVNQAVQSISDYKDRILVQQGRILQLRDEAGLPSPDGSKNQ